LRSPLAVFAWEKEERREDLPMNERDLFMAALPIEDAAERSAYLDRACAGDTVLRQRVEALLAAFEHAGSFLQQPAADPKATSDVSPRGPSSNGDPAEDPGTVIGSYKLVEPIGEGGMGTVWMAQQTEPVKRLVALKLIKAGMDSKQVIARFEAERQALALMDHPNIARVLDAGTSSTGRPYFVMDLVKGVPITRYCDEHRLTPRQRLELFIPVCQAVQHAHQKGIIHRDLKPSNVLVALYDGKPVPRVIDFGVAKAAGQALTDKTLVTGFGNIVGTLEYMSPEQAEINQLDIDTRSDIYSLGVLLYELLTGTTPLERKRVKEGGLLEALRIIREEETPRPSTRLSTAEGLPTLAANRGTEPAKLTKLVRGELDWIVMKALEKDRSRRYGTANGLAADVQRYLVDEPVLACPPSASYRLRKFARRNKGGLAAAGLVLGFLIVLGAGAGWALRDREAREQEAAQEAARKLAQTEEGIREAVDRAGSSRAELHAALKKKGGVQELLNQPARWQLFLRTAQSELAQARRLLAGAQGKLHPEVTLALARLEQQLARDEADYRLAVRLEKICLDQAIWVKVTFDYRTAAEEYPRALADFRVLDRNPEAAAARLATSPIKERLVAALDDWAWVACEVAGLKRNDVSEQLLAVARRAAPDEVWGNRLRRFEVWDNPKALARIVAEAPAAGLSPQLGHMVGNLLGRDPPRQVAWLRRAQAEHPTDFRLAFDLGNALPDSEAAEAAIWYRVALAIRPTSAVAYTNLGRALHAQKKFPEAIAACQKAIEIDPTQAFTYSGLGVVYMDQRRFPEAIAACQKAVELAPTFAGAHSNLAAALEWAGKLDEAVAANRKAIACDPKYAPAHRNLGLCLSRQRKWDEAIAAYHKAIDLEPKNAWGYNGLGAMFHEQRKFDEAITAYRKAIELDPRFALAYSNLSEALNFLAWALATDPVPTRPDSGRAVSLAREAVELKPQEGRYYNTLGVALYRAERWKDAIAALEKSMELRKGGNSFGWFFLAMTHWRLGEKDRARAWYDRAVRWMDRNQPKNDELRSFRAEAAELLELNEKKQDGS
jgi:serine/threonine protein kinase/tetratricopeptide (TPR) repeat protein